MADAPEQTAPPATTAPVVVETKPEQPLGENGEKALRAEREARKAAEKAHADLAARIKEFEDRDKTESERQADRLANLEKSNRELAAEKARYEAALTHGLSRDDLALLGPGDDIAERAALLAQRLGAAPKPPARLPETPNAGRESQVSDEDAEWKQFEAVLRPSNQQQ
jgi:hypothetical protein